jgi:hypothetical protein
MHTFFPGWRRKAGCVLLVIALLVTCVWLRSLVVADAFDIRWQRVYVRHGAVISVDGSVSATLNSQKRSRDQDGIYWVCIAKAEQKVSLYHYALEIPYWSITMPLTLLSAYLILSKPRKRE